MTGNASNPPVCCHRLRAEIAEEERQLAEAEAEMERWNQLANEQEAEGTRLGAEALKLEQQAVARASQVFK